MKVCESIDPHLLNSVKLKVFWVLDKLEEDDNDRFTATAIAKYLIDHGIKTSPQAVRYALKTDRHAIHQNSKGYKLMEAGRKLLQEIKPEGEVIVIEPGKPFSAKSITLKKIFLTLSNEIFISDPYLDINTLDVVFKVIDPKISIKILTNNIIDKPTGILNRHLKELRKEGYKIEIGIYQNSDLHDRYIMDNETFWLSGNSLNNLGNKESFIVPLGKDVQQSMMATFNNRWKVSKKI